MIDSLQKDMFYYLHIPKTAGTTINKLFSSQYPVDEVLTHIESSDLIKDPDKITLIQKYTYVSGHYSYPAAKNNLSISDRTTIATFRLPEEHVISHLCWVRLLGEPEHANRLAQHDKNIQSIVEHLKTVDLSNAEKIPPLIEWLEDNKYFLFHNTQARYLCGGAQSPALTDNQVKIALSNLDELDFVGTVDRLSDFISMLISTFSFDTTSDNQQRENANNHKFGMDHNNRPFMNALAPLIKYDQIIYGKAHQLFTDTFHDFHSNKQNSQQPISHSII